MAALKFTGIIFLVYLTVIAHVYADKKKDKCCQRLEEKIDTLTTMVENLECQAPKPACPDGWAYHEESCYLIVNMPTLKQSDARSTCLNLGGDLAIIRSEEENNFIFDLVKQQETVTRWGVWLGFIRKADNQFYWIDNTPLAGQYSRWASGEPNNHQWNGLENENCGNMFGSGSREGQWNDLWCDLVESQLEYAPSVLCQKKSNRPISTF